MLIEIRGNVGQVIVVEAGASPTIHIGDGQARVNGNRGGVSNRCPTRTTATQRTNWGARCVGASAPEGWSSETFSSEKAFVDSKVPNGLEKGDAIFFWKRDCDRNSAAPEGFQFVHLSEDGVGIIVPVAPTTVGDEEDHLFSNVSSLSPEDDDENNDDGDDSAPLPPPAGTSLFEED